MGQPRCIDLSTSIGMRIAVTMAEHLVRLKQGNTHFSGVPYF